MPIGGVNGPADALVTIRDEDDQMVDEPAIHFANDRLQVIVAFDEPGIYQVEVSGGGTTTISQRCLATDP